MLARKYMKAIDNSPDRHKALQQFGVAIVYYPIKGQDLSPKDIKDAIRGVIVFNSISERIIHEVYPCLPSVVAQGNTKNFIRDRRGGEWAVSAAQRHEDVHG